VAEVWTVDATQVKVRIQYCCACIQGLPGNGQVFPEWSNPHKSIALQKGYFVALSGYRLIPGTWSTNAAAQAESDPFMIFQGTGLNA
jgi:hypothetical protein